MKKLILKILKSSEIFENQKCEKNQKSDFVSTFFLSFLIFKNLANVFELIFEIIFENYFWKLFLEHLFSVFFDDSKKRISLNVAKYHEYAIF